MADDKKNIPDTGKDDEPPKPGRVEPVKADPPVQDQPASAKAEAPVTEDASKVVTPPTMEKPVEGKTVPHRAAVGQGREADHDPRHGRSRPRWESSGFYRCQGWGGEGQAPGKGCGPG